MEHVLERKNENVLKNWHLFVIVTLIYIILSIMLSKLILSRDLYANIFGADLDDNKIDIYYNIFQKINFISVFLLPIILLIKYTLSTLLLKLPLLLKDIVIPFKEVYRIMLIASFCLILSNVANFIWITSSHTYELTKETIFLIPFSLTSLINTSSYSVSMLKFLNKINIFEILWIVVVFWGLYKTKKLKKIDAFIITFCFWTGIEIMFFAINFYMESLGL
jgi:hypothetical protein